MNPYPLLKKVNNQKKNVTKKRGLDKKKKILVIFVENLPSPHNNNNKVVVFASLVRKISSHPEQKCWCCLLLCCCCFRCLWLVVVIVNVVMPIICLDKDLLSRSILNAHGGKAYSTPLCSVSLRKYYNGSILEHFLFCWKCCTVSISTLIPVLQTNHSCRLLLFQVTYKIPESTKLRQGRLSGKTSQNYMYVEESC